MRVLENDDLRWVAGGCYGSVCENCDPGYLPGDGIWNENWWAITADTYLDKADTYFSLIDQYYYNDDYYTSAQEMAEIDQAWNQAQQQRGFMNSELQDHYTQYSVQHTDWSSMYVENTPSWNGTELVPGS